MRRLYSVVLSSCLFVSALSAQAAPYVPSTDLPNGRQILAIYLGANSCGPCHNPAVKEAVHAMKVLVATQARNTGASFAAIGVANDWDPREAASFLADSGPFDQLVLGGNFTNLAFEQFVWRDPNGKAAMPQIVIVQRTVKPGSTAISISESRILRRILGIEEIAAWVKQGTPISPSIKP